MLTQQQWFDRLVSWYPAWYVKQGGVFEAHLWATAGVLRASVEDATSEQAKTFIDFAEDDVLDTHGAERSIIRRTDETDEDLRVRVKNFALSVTQEDLQAAVNTLLLGSTQAQFFDRMTYGPFLDSDDIFGDNGDLFMMSQERLYNWFYIYIPPLVSTVLASDLTIPEGETKSYVALRVPAGVTLTINGTMNFVKFEVEGTVVVGPNGIYNNNTAEDFYATITAQVKAVKAFGVQFEIWSEAFE